MVSAATRLRLPPELPRDSRPRSQHACQRAFVVDGVQPRPICRDAPCSRETVSGYRSSPTGGTHDIAHGVRPATVYARRVLDSGTFPDLDHLPHEGIVDLRGHRQLHTVEGIATVGDDGGITGRLVVDATSLNTKNGKRDEHLRSADFFDVQKYPTIVFTAAEARPAHPGHVHLDGDLTVHGQTRPLTVPAEVVATDDTATVSAEILLDRSNWGMTYTKKGSRLATRVVINAVFVKS
jgi:polyisoprenoid-binding protein YceI